MAVVRIPDENRTLTDTGEITEYLAGVGIEYGKVPAAPGVSARAALICSSRASSRAFSACNALSDDRYCCSLSFPALFIMSCYKKAGPN